MKNFFENLEMPFREMPDRDRLEGPLTTREIENAIRNIKTRKAPGTDGFPSDFYKRFAPKLIPLLYRVYEEVLDKKNFTSNNVTGYDLCAP